MKVNYRCYYNYKSSNYGNHALVFTDPTGDEYYFSYGTLVAFTHAGKRFTRVNDWSNTTGKHLNAIEPDHKKRLTGDNFTKLYQALKGDQAE